MSRRKRKKAEAEARSKKKRGGFKKLVFLVLVGGAAAIALSESVRNKALDVLFGAEEEFQYTPPSAPASDASGAQS
jgi:hypothetical protein